MTKPRPRAVKEVRAVSPEARICEACGSDRVMSLALTLDDGRPVDFTSCRVCEHRTWRDDAGVIPLADVTASAGAAAAMRRARAGRPDLRAVEDTSPDR